MTQPATGGDEFTAEQRKILMTVLVPAFLSLLSVSIINVTLPAIATSLHASTSGLQWVVSGYALVFGVLLVPAGRAGDLWGRGKIFVAGLALFGLGALLSGLAPSILMLNLGMAIVMIGLAGTIAVALLHDRGVSEWWMLLTLGIGGLGQGMVVPRTRRSAWPTSRSTTQAAPAA